MYSFTAMWLPALCVAVISLKGATDQSQSTRVSSPRRSPLARENVFIIVCWHDWPLSDSFVSCKSRGFQFLLPFRDNGHWRYWIPRITGDHYWSARLLVLVFVVFAVRMLNTSISLTMSSILLENTLATIWCILFTLGYLLMLIPSAFKQVCETGLKWDHSLWQAMKTLKTGRMPRITPCVHHLWALSICFFFS